MIFKFKNLKIFKMNLQISASRNVDEQTEPSFHLNISASRNVDGRIVHLNIWTYNINSIRNKVAIINDLLDKHNIDILFVTETKITKNLEADVEKQLHRNYKVIWNSNQKKYHHGTAFIYSKFLKVELLQNFLPKSNAMRLNITNTKHNRIMSKVESNVLNEDIEKAHK